MTSIERPFCSESDDGRDTLQDGMFVHRQTAAAVRLGIRITAVPSGVKDDPGFAASGSNVRVSSASTLIKAGFGCVC
jgi:hypothetical protein